MLFNEFDWTHDSLYFWKGWPNIDSTAEMQFMYAMYLAFYVHFLILVFLDTRSSDFVALVVHHVITLAITASSWTMRFTQVGCFTMALYDVSDIFLEIAKCFNYSQRLHPRLSTGADVSFFVFATSFFYLRLYVFPVRIVHSIFFQACEHVTCVGNPWPIEKCLRTGAAIGFVPIVLALQLLQLFWAWKIIGVVASVVRGKPLEDPRDE